LDFSLSEEQEMLKKTARNFLEKECPEKLVREVEETIHGYSLELWRKIADLGWLGLIYPEKYGGLAGSILDLIILSEEMGRAMYSSPYLSTIVLCGQIILSVASETQKDEILPKMLRGELTLALALTEPESSWSDDAWESVGVTVTAKTDGDNYIINGTKLFVYDAKYADHFLVATKTKKSKVSGDGVTLFLVDAKALGIQCTLLKTIAPDKQYEVVFNNVLVPKTNMIGTLNNAWPAIARSLQIGSLVLCAEMVGAGRRLLELSIEYAKTRIQFEQPIGVNQYIQDFCCSMMADINGSSWLTYQAAWKACAGLPCDPDVSKAKAWTNDAHERVCYNAHQVHAGAGYTIDNGVIPMYTRRAKAKQLYLGNSSYHLKKYSEHIATWQSIVKPLGRPINIFDIPAEEQVPEWEPWKERWEKKEKKKEEANIHIEHN
jgi:3-oxocholest-4-en-26-oyl-CoA dehydrogenase beta subunit